MKNHDGFREKVINILKAAEKLIIHNWPFKLLAVVIAVVIWSALIANDETLIRSKTFSNVEISVIGQDTAKRNGFIVVDGADNIPTCTMSVDVPQKQYERVQASIFNLRMDLSKIRQEGEQEIKLTTTNSTTYGSVNSVEPQTVTVRVESYVTRYRIPVTAIVVGSVNDKFYATSPALDPPSVRISGPKSLVNRVARIEVEIDQSLLPKSAGTYQTAYPYRLVDASGEEIESKLIEVTSESVLIDSIVAEQTVYEKKELELEKIGLVTGEPAHGYEVKNVTVVPEKVTAAGKKESLDLLDRLFTDTKIDVTDLTESVQTNVALRKPGELNYISTNMVGITVEIGESVTTREFKEIRVKAENIEDGLSASFSTKYVTAYVTGTTLSAEQLKSANVYASIDAFNLPVGEYDLPVMISVDSQNDFDTKASEEYIHVVIKEKK